MAIEQIELDNLLARRPESLEDLTAQISPAIYSELKSAVELRKFGDGSRLSQAQLENCLQLVILYEATQLPEHQRTGFDIPVSCKSQQAGANGTGNNGAGNNSVQMWGKD